MGAFKKLKFALLGIIFIVLIGVGGFMLIEGWGVVDSLYMTTITLSTVGFSEINPVSQHGRIFIIVLILSGLGVASYALTVVTKFIVEGEFAHFLRRKKMEEILKNMSGHYIICGSGKSAHEILKELVKKGKNIIHIDEMAQSDEEITHHQEEKIIKVKGDPTDDIILEKGKIRKAKALLVATDSDASNLYITLSARQISGELYIVALAEKESSIHKFRKAGANRVVSILGIGAKRMASSVLRPSVVDFLEVAMYGEDFQLQMEELEVNKDSFLDQKKLKDSEIRTRSGVIVLAIRRESRLAINPEADFTILPKDKLIVLGSFEQIKKMTKLTHSF
ncbi:MAG: potassium channel family protein [Candidatus Muiribacteriota bacterium]